MNLGFDDLKTSNTLQQILQLVLTDLATGGDHPNCVSIDSGQASVIHFNGQDQRFNVPWSSNHGQRFRDQRRSIYASLNTDFGDRAANRFLDWERVKHGLTYEVARDLFVPVDLRSIAREEKHGTTISDDFQGHTAGNNLSVDSNWTRETGPPGDAFIRDLDGGGDLGPRARGSESDSIYTHNDTFSGNDFDCLLRGIEINGNAFEFGPLVRHNGTVGYTFHLAENSSDNRLRRFTSTTAFVNIGGTLGTLNWVDGDTQKVDVSGSTLEAFQNGGSLGTRTDTNITTGTQAGISFNGAGGSTGVGYGDFSATDGVVSGISIPVVYHHRQRI